MVIEELVSLLAGKASSILLDSRQSLVTQITHSYGPITEKSQSGWQADMEHSKRDHRME